MEITDLSKWIEHIKEPLVLVGFVIMLIAGLVSIFLKKDIFHLTKTASERIVKRIFLYAFVLGIAVLVLGFALAFRNEFAKNTAGTKEPILQETKGEQSPAVVTKEKGAHVEITYGSPSKTEGAKKSQVKDDSTKEDKLVSPPGRIEQKTQGSQSPAVVSNGDVNINYKNK